MTIKEYLAGLPEMIAPDGTPLKETMQDCVDIWSNDACKGYCIAAMKAAEMNDDQIKAVLYELRYLFDMKSIEEAEAIYNTTLF